MTEAKRRKIIRAAFDSIKEDGFAESVKNRTFPCYEDNEETGETRKCGKFILFYVEVDGETVALTATSYDNHTIVITSLSHRGIRIVFTLNDSNHSWSGVHAIGEIGDDDYISMHDILINVISVLKKILFDKDKV